MKVTVTATIFLSLVTMGAMTAASGITITSSEFRISGDWTERWSGLPGSVDENSLDEVSGAFSSSTTRDTPISAAVISSPHGWSEAGATIDSFNLAMFGYANHFSGHVQDGVVVQPGTEINIWASSITRFQPAETLINLNLETYSRWVYDASQSNLSVTLRDLTTSAILIGLENLDDLNSVAFYESYSLNVDPTHEYELILAGRILAYDNDETIFNAHIDIEELSPSPPPPLDSTAASVPDSGRTVLMLALALSGLLWIKRG